MEWNGVCVISFFWVTDLFCWTKSSQSQERRCCEWYDHQMTYMYTKHFTASIRKGREREFGRKTAREGEGRKRWSAFCDSHARGRRNPLSKLNTCHAGYLAITTTQGWVANQQWLYGTKKHIEIILWYSACFPIKNATGSELGIKKNYGRKLSSCTLTLFCLLVQVLC